MSDNDIKFVLRLSKAHFDMIVTIMLHDACHDFDNDKSNAAFKEYFFSNKAVPTTNAVSRLQKISIALGAPPPSADGGGGFMKGGMDGLGGTHLIVDQPPNPDQTPPRTAHYAAPPYNSPAMSQPDSPHSPLSPFPEKRDPATMRRTTTKSEEEEIKELEVEW